MFDQRQLGTRQIQAALLPFRAGALGRRQHANRLASSIGATD
jgi:hypothetical protein